MDIGGNVPKFLTTLLMIDVVKDLFNIPGGAMLSMLTYKKKWSRQPYKPSWSSHGILKCGERAPRPTYPSIEGG
jgi:hypothetical protein